MRLVVRTWNVFHGRTKPASGRAHLERMVRLIGDGAQIVALQEVPAWALRDVGRWSGMAVGGAVARPARLGVLGRRATALAPDLLRSALNGQANAVLLGRPLAFAGRQRLVALKRRGALEARVCQLVPVRVAGRTLTVANFHATAHLPAIARREVDRVGEALAGEEPAIVCGDFNVANTGLSGFSEPIRGIDQILVRGLELEHPPARWPPERRRFDGHLLSDHAPIEAVVRA